MASSLLTYCPRCRALMNRMWAACAVCGEAMTQSETEVPLQETPPVASATQESQSSRGAAPSGRAEDTLAQYWSDVLHERFWVAPTDAQAAALAAQGQVAYQPDEIWRLCDLKAHDPQTFAVKLRAIHQAKTIFGATITQRSSVAER